MNTTAQFITYSQAGVFSKTVTDYVSGNAALQPFYKHAVSIDGIKAAIKERTAFSTNRSLLVAQLQQQYAATGTSEKVKANIEKLQHPNTFTITTAHQPNLFTGHLYFVYKILHAVKLAAFLEEQIAGSNFVPVYYMGSEDADLEELGHVYIDGQKYEWQTAQTGAVGRMKVDAALVQLIDAVSGQILVAPFGNEIIGLIKDCYKEGITIEQATFKLVNELFKEYGVVVLLPDNAALKAAFAPIIEKELETAFSHKAVEETVHAFPKEYKVQAGGRELNLFYLTENARERIIAENTAFRVHNSTTVFSSDAMKQELQQHPERFSPNVILRPVFQEMLLPNIAFIGGGGELAYWLELKKVFEAAQVPYPVLILRNSFMVVEEKYKTIAQKMEFALTDLFKPEAELHTILVKRETALQLGLEKEIAAMKALYAKLQDISGAVDKTLVQHTAALQAKAVHKLEGLQKKMLRAEKRKYEAQQRQIHTLRAVLFPGNGLQERTENIIPFYAKWGSGFIEQLYKNSRALEQEFCILEMQ
jgi:bacillithiol synthase